jgi:hypothetical protein
MLVLQAAIIGDAIQSNGRANAQPPSCELLRVDAFRCVAYEDPAGVRASVLRLAGAHVPFARPRHVRGERCCPCATAINIRSSKAAQASSTYRARAMQPKKLP